MFAAADDLVVRLRRNDKAECYWLSINCFPRWSPAGNIACRAIGFPLSRLRRVARVSMRLGLCASNKHMPGGLA